MMPTSRTSTQLIAAGLVLVVLSTGNLMFGWSDALADAVQYQQIQADSGQEIAPAVESISTVTPVQEGQTLAPVGFDRMQSVRPVSVVTPTLQAVDTYVPDRIAIPAIHLDAAIVATEVKSIELREQWFSQWQVPDEFAAGWIDSSAPLGVTGNTVLSGHHNAYGKVFGHLVELKVGDTLTLYSGNLSFEYVITERLVVKEKDVSLAIRQENARWIAPTPDERVTLVTCWPKRNNTHRLILVARPVETDATFPGDSVN